MLKRLLLFAGTLTAVAVGSVGFAAYESHIINVKAHVEKATYVTPDEIDFGITLMQDSYSAACNPQTGEPIGDLPCMKIHLSNSFIDEAQDKYITVEYLIYCEVKAGLNPDDEPWDADHQITPYITLTDSDLEPDGSILTSGGDVRDTDQDGVADDPVPNSCRAAAGVPEPWVVGGTLMKGLDEVDAWDMHFFAPLCDDNYNPETDPSLAVDLIDSEFCNKGDPPLPNSYEQVDLGSDIKFQVDHFEQ